MREVCIAVLAAVAILVVVEQGIKWVKAEFGIQQAPSPSHVLPDEPGWYVVPVHMGPEVGVFCLVKPEEIQTRPPRCWLGMRGEPQ